MQREGTPREQAILGDIMSRKRQAPLVKRPGTRVADPTIGDRIVRKAGGGGRSESLWAVPVYG